MATTNNSHNDPIIQASATADCPACGGFVRLTGEGRRGEHVKLKGNCPAGHLVLFPHTIV
jgi:hypothetical protein